MPDPYFGGEGPDRTGCLKCGACMVGCRTGAKNTLVKNYLLAVQDGRLVRTPVTPGRRWHDGRLVEVDRSLAGTVIVAAPLPTWMLSVPVPTAVLSADVKSCEYTLCACARTMLLRL